MFLERILKTKRQEVAGLQIKTSLNQLKKWQPQYQCAEDLNRH
nr:hypothetical protein [Paenibacillus larvae]